MSKLDDLLSEMPAIAEAVNAFTSPEVQRRAFDVLMSAAGVGDNDVDPAEEDTGAPPVLGDDSAKKAAARKRKPASASKKQTLAQLKDLDLHSPSPSLEQFVADKKPANNTDKCVVCVYWLRETGGVEPITVNHVYTCFKSMGWLVPSDLPNTLQKAGSSGHLDTSERDAIKLTTSGENRVEHQLPATSGE